MEEVGRGPHHFYQTPCHLLILVFLSSYVAHLYMYPAVEFFRQQTLISPGLTQNICQGDLPVSQRTRSGHMVAEHHS